MKKKVDGTRKLCNMEEVAGGDGDDDDGGRGVAVPCLVGAIVIEVVTMVAVVGSFWPILLWATLVLLIVRLPIPQ